jgi:hypothetical protein
MEQYDRRSVVELNEIRSPSARHVGEPDDELPVLRTRRREGQAALGQAIEPRFGEQTCVGSLYRDMTAMPVIRIVESQQMTHLVETLADDVIHARFHYDLLLGLAEEFASDIRVYNESAAFWGLVNTALRDAVLVRLSRAYDQERRSLSLLNWLETIRANLQLFEPGAFRQRIAGNAFIESLSATPRIPDAARLDEDIESVSKDDPLVKRLIRLRHNAYAHMSANAVAAGTHPFRTHALLPPEYVALLERGRAILNRYSSLFNASTFSDQLVGRRLSLHLQNT